MTANALNVWGEIIGIAGGGLVFLIFGIFFSSASRQIKTPPGSSGRRSTPGEQEAHNNQGEQGGETVRADGYIDSFAGVIEEGGGGPPLLIKIALVAIPLWWLGYILLNWSQSILSMRTFIK